MLTTHCHANAVIFLPTIKQQQTITVKTFQFLLLVTATILNGRWAVTILKWDLQRTIPDQFGLIGSLVSEEKI